MMRKFFLSTMVLVLLALPTCQVQKLRLKQQYRQLNELVHREAQKDSIPFIKCHLQNGGVVVFQKNWHLDTAAAEISGQGRYFDFNRERLKEGFLRVGMDSVALYEANRLEPGLESRRLAGLMILSGLNIAGTIFCAHNPKACFGSCPTFYTGPGKSVHEAAAEGFSRAIFPSLAYADVDDLDTVTTAWRPTWCAMRRSWPSPAKKKSKFTKVRRTFFTRVAGRKRQVRRSARRKALC
jgi:hypothetical protein